MSAWRVEGAVRVSRSFTLPNSRPEPGERGRLRLSEIPEKEAGMSRRFLVAGMAAMLMGLAAPAAAGGWGHSPTRRTRWW
jgi:hypothetical protein